MVAAAVARGPAAAAAVEWERFPDVLPGFKKADTDPARMALKRKADEGFLHPNNKKAKNEDASSDEEEYPPKFPDFDWLCLVILFLLPNCPLYKSRTQFLILLIIQCI